jgi:two-component system cell cycle sensor histidine kinase/response regulator CckA
MDVPFNEPGFWRSVVMNAPSGILIITPDGAIKFINRILPGLSATDVVGRSVYDFVSEQERPVIHAAIARVLETGKSAEYYVYSIGETGQSAWYAARLAPLTPGNTDFLLMVSMDITEQRRLEKEARERNEQLLSFLEHIPAIVWILDAEMRYVYVNEAYERTFKFPRGSCAGKSMDEVWPPDIAARFDAKNRELLHTGEDKRVIETIGEGSSMSHWLASSFLVRADNVRLVGGVAIDITENRRAERERQDLDRKLFETQKLESLGVLAGGVAHDFNNLLAIILGNINIARWHADRGIPIEPQLQTIESIAMQAAAICRQLLTYAGKKAVDKTVVDLNRAISDVRDLLRSSWQTSAQVSETLQTGLPLVSGDDVQLRQIFLNLMMNALEAIGKDDGRVRISTGVSEIDPDCVAAWEITPAIAPGSYVYAAVEDNGCGMNAQTKARIFEPFFSTKFTGRGLGLAAVLGILRNHKGGMRVQSEPGRGSTFTVYLPRLETASRQ